MIESGECPLNSQESRIEQFRMLDNLANNQEFCYCGPSFFQNMRMYHNGERWVVELESIHKEG